MKDFYRVLDLPQDASQQQIKDRYRQLVRIFHPDRYPKPEDKLYAEQKLQEINEAYEGLYGEPSRGLRLSSDRRPPQPVVYPEHIDLGSVVHGERAHALFQIDNIGGFAQALNFHFEEGADWFAITKGERMDPGKPLPMLLHIEARTSSLTVGQVVENWLDIDVNGVRARATLRMKVVDQSSAVLRPGRVVSSIAAVVALLVVVYAAWALQGATPTDRIVSTLPTHLSEATSMPDDGLPVAVAPPSTASVETSEGATTGTEAETPTVGTEAPWLSNQTPESRQSNSSVLRSVSQIVPAAGPPAADPGVDESSAQPLEKVDAVDGALMTTELATVIVEPEVMNESNSDDKASSISQADVVTATVQVIDSAVIMETTTTLAPSTPEPPTPFPAPTKTLSPTPTPSPTPTNSPVTITVPQSYQINARSETTTESESLALLDKGATFPAIARTIDNAWTQIVLPDGRTGWVFTTSMVANLAQIETLPISVDLLSVEPAAISQSTGVVIDPMPASQETTPVEETTVLTDSVDTPGQGAESKPDQQFHLVVAGDFLKQLALQYYGDEELWSLIYEANIRLIGPDPNVLTAGIELTIPIQ